MNRKPPELPNIEDATLRACLAPLMGVMQPGGDTASHPAPPDSARHGTDRVPAGSNDNPAPVAKAPEVVDGACSGTPKTLAESRSLADDEHGAFRMMELFLAMSDTELLAAAADFPKQIGGTMARIAQIKRRLAAQYDAATTVLALLERALARAAADPHDC